MHDSPLAASADIRPRALAAERVLHHLRPLVAVIDKTGVFVDAWGAHGAFLGYRPEGLIGRQSLELVVPREQEMVASIFQQAAERQDFSVDMPVPFQLTLVAVSAGETDTDIWIEVKDTGLGIAEVEQQTIFEAFRRAEDTRTAIPAGSGSGLGLAISKRAIDQMEGQISVRSEPGRGSTFTIALRSTELALEHPSL